MRLHFWGYHFIAVGGMLISVPAVAMAEAQAAVADDSGAAVVASTSLPATIPDIVVTAQRYDESLSKTPVAVSVLTANDLANAQIGSEQDLRESTPGLSVRAGSNSNQLNYALRGQTQDVFSGTRPGVLPYVNEVQIGGPGGSSAFYDLQSIQVLKGPQGTLFGRSATGGAVLFTTAQPTDSFGGYVSASGGNYGAVKLEGALNMPLIGDRLIARVAGIYDKRDGFQYNLFDDRRVGDRTREGGRLSVTANIGDRLRNNFVFDYLHSDSQSTTAVLSGFMPFTGNGPPFVPLTYLYAGTATQAANTTGQCTLQAFAGLPPCSGTQGVLPAVAGFYSGYFANPHHPSGGVAGELAAQQARGPYVINSDAPNFYEANNRILTNSTTYTLTDHVNFKNTFGYVLLGTQNSFDADGTPYTISGTVGQGVRVRTRQTSEEPQLQGNAFNGRLDFTGGFYFSDESETSIWSQRYFDLAFGGFSQTNAYTITNRTYAGYGQGTFALNDAGLAMTAGIRYTSESVGIVTLPVDSIRQGLGDSAPPGYSYDQSATFDLPSWTFGIQDQLDPNLLIYIASRRAYKSGGFNGLVAPKIGDGDTGGNAFEEQRVTDVEAGSKYNGTIGSVPVRAAFDLFYDWTRNDEHTGYALVGVNPAAVTVNVPQATTYGAELEGQIKPLHQLTLGGTANYLRARFGSALTGVNGTLQRFDQVPDTPEFSGSLFADIEIPVNGDVSLLLHGDVYYQAHSFISPQSINSIGTVIPSYTIGNFRIGVQDKRAGWSLTANLKNAFDRTYYVGGLPLGELTQENLLIPGERRTFTVEARFKF